MINKSILVKIFVLILISIALFSNLYVYSYENLEEKFKLLEDVRKEIEEKASKELKPWRGQQYKYIRASFSGNKDKDGIYCFTNCGYKSNIVYDNYAQMSDYIYEITKEYFNQYLITENEKEKMKGFFITEYFPYTRDTEYSEKKDIEGKVTIFFVPEVKSSKWCDYADKAYTKIYSEKNKEFIEINGYYTHIYVRLIWENDKYVIGFIDSKPEGYDEFVARMKDHGIDVENIDYPSLINAKTDIKEEIQVAEKKEFDVKQTEIKILNKWIVVVFGIIIILIIIINIVINNKDRKK